jgi:hypothetical protein
MEQPAQLPPAEGIPAHLALVEIDDWRKGQGVRLQASKEIPSGSSLGS